MVSAISTALEREVAALQALTHRAKCASRNFTAGEESERSHHFGKIMRLLGSRIQYFTRQYGLDDMPDDAWQACAIGAHRAIEAYDRDQASFTTLVNWQLRGELQSLRHRVRLDQRDSAGAAGIRTVSMDIDRPEAPVFSIVDEGACDRVEAGASRSMALNSIDWLLDRYFAGRTGGEADAAPRTTDPDRRAHAAEKNAAERAMMGAYFRDLPLEDVTPDLSSEQRRQVTRRIVRGLEKQVRADPCYSDGRY